MKTIDWEQRRYEIAKGLMVGFASREDGNPENLWYFARLSVKGAKVLIEMLKKEPEDRTEGEELDKILSLPVNGLGLSKRVMNSLRDGDVQTVGDLVKVGRSEYASWRHVGSKSRAEVAELMKNLGLVW